MKTHPTSVLVAWVVLVASCGDAVAADGDLAVRAQAILYKHCYRCHGVRLEVEGYDVLDWASLVAPRENGKRPYVVPGKPDESALWHRLGVEQDMPPEDPQPSDAERSVIKQWIASKARLPRLEPGSRRLLTEAAVLRLVHDDLLKAPVGDRKFRRYLSIHNLHNDRSIAENDLRLARAAIGKLLNSLSWMSQIVTPEAIDPDHTVFAFDLRDVGWDRRDLWKKILTSYPYGMTHIGDRGDAELGQIAQEIYDITDVKLPYLRADWLIATASRPPLYHTILDLPDSAEKLERLLEIDVEGDFLNDRIKRAGFSKSGISSQNRVVERHLGKAIYWRSYDFRHSEGTSNIFQFPLGPVFEKNPYAQQAFKHAGSEIVFSLPNGMPAYLLANADGERIDVAPIEIVSDNRKNAGSPQVTTGLSCMGCHEKGIQRLEDSVRRGLSNEDAREPVDRMYIEKASMDRVLKKDEEQFWHAIAKAMRPYWVKDAESAEPIRTAAFRYNSELGAAEVAAELGVENAKKLLDTIRANPRLKGLGLDPLLANVKIKRSVWETRENKSTSLFQDAALELRLGAPFLDY